jgi:hypothetical protein
MTESTIEDTAERQGLDPFVKRYLLALIILLAAGAAYYFSQLDRRVGEINARLAASPVLADYPYRFRVLSLNNGVAVVTSPRSAQMGPMHFLRVLDASLNDKDVLHPDMMAAQQTLAEKQLEAERIVRAEPDVERVRWQLDERWYAEHGIFLPQ